MAKGEPLSVPAKPPNEEEWEAIVCLSGKARAWLKTRVLAHDGRRKVSSAAARLAWVGWKETRQPRGESGKGEDVRFRGFGFKGPAR